jgi:cobalamin biosynthesis Mg chelatase CobN
MPVFRRNSAGATDGKAQDSQAAQSPEAQAKSKPSAQAGKGRPTPKRSEAERNRYQTVTGSTTSGRGPSTGTPARGKATPEDKARARADRTKRMEAMRRGEDWALMPRDRGPVRKLARDYVDSHRRPSEYYMYILLLLLVALLSRNKALNTYVTPFVLVLIVVVALDAYYIRRALRRLVAERFPGESTRGLTMYAVMRALQIRRFRNPLPRLKPGDKF